MDISFHIGILPNRTMQENVNLGLKTEELGYEGVWVADSHSIMRDAYAVLAVLATQTRHLKLASGVTLTGTRHPAVLANSWPYRNYQVVGRSWVSALVKALSITWV